MYTEGEGRSGGSQPSSRHHLGRFYINAWWASGLQCTVYILSPLVDINGLRWACFGVLERKIRCTVRGGLTAGLP